jgi:hypothetical protein
MVAMLKMSGAAIADAQPTIAKLALRKRSRR